MSEESESLYLQRGYSAPAQVIWTAWTDPQVLSLWDPDLVEGEFAEGRTVWMHWTSYGVSLPVQVIEFVPEERMRLQVDRPNGQPYYLQLRVEPEGAKGSRLHLSFFGEMTAEEVLGTAASWHSLLEVLACFTELEVSSRDSHSIMGAAPIGPKEAFEAGVAMWQWLGEDAPRVQREGQEFQLRLRDDLQISGRIVSLVDDYEFAIWCKELSGVIRFRSLPLAAGQLRLLGVQLTLWNDAPERSQIVSALEAAVERLIDKLGGQMGTH